MLMRRRQKKMTPLFPKTWQTSALEVYNKSFGAETDSIVGAFKVLEGALKFYYIPLRPKFARFLEIGGVIFLPSSHKHFLRSTYGGY
jgi:hypothetical protein